MKKFLYVILLAVFGIQTNTNAQVDTSWVKRFNGPLNSSDAGLVIKVDDNGFVYVGASITKTQGYTDAAVIKYNPNGDTLWLRYYNTLFNNGSTLHDMQIDNNGNIIITGQCGDSHNLADYFTIKFDDNGNTLWSETYDQGDMDVSLAMKVDNTGNIFITGASWRIFQSNNILTIKYSSNGDTLWSYMWVGQESAVDIGKDIELDSYGNIIVVGSTDWYWGTVDYITIKINSGGDTLWVRKYDSPEHGHDYIKAVGVDYSGNIYVAGDSYIFGGNHDIIIIKYNTDGDTIWTRRYQGAGLGDDKVNAMMVDSIGNIYLAGSSFVSGNGIDCLTMKYNSAGDLVWAKTYGEYSYYSDVANSLALDKLGNVYVTGTAGTSSSNIAYLTIKYDNDGNEKWIAKYDGPGYNGYDNGNSIFVDNSGYVYITGSSPGLTSGNDVATIKYIQSPSDINDNPVPQPMKYELFQNYPNPFNPNTKIKFTVTQDEKRETRNVTLKVYDILGNEVATLVNEEKSAGVYDVQFDATGLSSGVYFYQINAGNFLQTKKMILIK